MQINKTEFDGLYVIEKFVSNDNRGSFIKFFNYDEFIKNGIETHFEECYYSASAKNVIRGMHFQLPPHSHDKLVTVIKGSVTDVVVDLRKNSKTYKKVFSIELSEKNNKALFIPVGMAHGFVSREDNTTMLYNVGTGYCKECDCGIKYNSIDYLWNVEKPIVSERDENFETIDNFRSPF